MNEMGPVEIYGWGRYPRVDATVIAPASIPEVVEAIRGRSSVVARGLGRSYGDSSLSTTVIDATTLDLMVSFDERSGDLTCQSGVSFDEILRTFVPRGWFLPVTPGTRFVTVGGAIASDVHGKNHHVAGTFADHVRSMRILLGDGSIVQASRTERSDLFFATCGGMGLTGVILDATFTMKSIASSDIVETVIKSFSLDETLAGFDEFSSSTYSVAWIDCLATGRQLGRSILTVGENAPVGPLKAHSPKMLTVPIDVPAPLNNKITMSTFNALYFHKTVRRRHTHTVPYEPFFYPLDVIGDWNRGYGKPGFVQYQVVLPAAAGSAPLKDLLLRIARSGRGSTLAVLKAFGDANQNHLSFPFRGYTLALDFKAEPGVFEMLDELDRLVLSVGGRVYLTKDARMSPETFLASYPRVSEFESVRAKYHATGTFSSTQSRRLGLL